MESPKVRCCLRVSVISLLAVMALAAVGMGFALHKVLTCQDSNQQLFEMMVCLTVVLCIALVFVGLLAMTSFAALSDEEKAEGWDSEGKGQGAPSESGGQADPQPQSQPQPQVPKNKLFLKETKTEESEFSWEE